VRDVDVFREARDLVWFTIFCAVVAYAASIALIRNGLDTSKMFSYCMPDTSTCWVSAMLGRVEVVMPSMVIPRMPSMLRIWFSI